MSPRIGSSPASSPNAGFSGRRISNRSSGRSISNHWSVSRPYSSSPRKDRSILVVASSWHMRILGIETSCDETSAAVVEETGDPAKPWAVRSNIVASQVQIHREWGGVVPELASRQHIRDICTVVERALAGANAGWRDLGAIAVTQGPGLVGSLLVGVSFAKAAAAAAALPLIA